MIIYSLISSFLVTTIFMFRPFISLSPVIQWIRPSSVHTFSLPNFSTQFLYKLYLTFVRFSEITTLEPLSFFLLSKTVFLCLYDVKRTMIGLFLPSRFGPRRCVRLILFNVMLGSSSVALKIPSTFWSVFSRGSSSRPWTKMLVRLLYWRCSSRSWWSSAISSSSIFLSVTRPSVTAF